MWKMLYLSLASFFSSSLISSLFSLLIILLPYSLPWPFSPWSLSCSIHLFAFFDENCTLLSIVISSMCYYQATMNTQNFFFFDSIMLANLDHLSFQGNSLNQCIFNIYTKNYVIIWIALNLQFNIWKIGILIILTTPHHEQMLSVFTQMVFDIFSDFCSFIHTRPIFNLCFVNDNFISNSDCILLVYY